METRSTQLRLDHQEEHLQKLQLEVTEIKTALQALEADQAKNAEFRKFMMGWVKQQEKQPLPEAGGAPGASDYSASSFVFTGGGRGGDGPVFKASDGIPWAVKKVKLPEFFGFDPQGWIQKAILYFDINGTP